MTRPSILLRLAILAAAASLAGACGDEGDDAPRADPATRPTTTTRAATSERGGRPCPFPAPVLDPSTEHADARGRIDGAVDVATRTDRRFVTRLELLLVGTQGRFRARLTGTRRADGSSRATLRWSDPAALLLPDAELAVRANRILLRTGPDGTGRWRDAGSASGVALDVGRELLDHPFLLRVVGAARAGERLDVTLESPPPRLRAYATSERNGPVTELLRAARSLRITANLDDGELVGDRFRLVTTVPEGIPALAPLAGRVVVVTGTTGSCALTR